MTTPPTSSLAMIRTLGLVAAVCGGLVVTAYEGTLASIAANRRLALERAVFQTVPGAVRLRAYVATPAGIAPADDAAAQAGERFYAAYDAQGRLLGIAAEAAAYGYADQVRVLYAYDPAREAITGLTVVAHRETPGIGDKVITDAAFQANFRALDARLNAERTALANPIRVVRHGSKRAPWEIDAIAGATVTSRAVGKAVNASAQRLLPLLAAHLEALRQEAVKEGT